MTTYCSLTRAPRRAVDILWTLFLFTKSDVKTASMPVILFAASVAPAASCSRVLSAICWAWLHSLQAGLSNQIVSPEEDAVNKPDRPLPSGRITLKNAVRLRWILVPVCWAVSLGYSTQVLCTSIVFSAYAVLYNECAVSRHWLLRGMLNAVALTSLEAGATLIAGVNRAGFDAVAIWSLYVSAGVIATTIHTADFKDTDGDRAIGRRTLSIAYPDIARYTVLLLLLAWSVALACVWTLGPLSGVVLVSLGIFTGARFVVASTVRADRVSYYWYNVWLSVVYALPAYHRHYSSIR